MNSHFFSRTAIFSSQSQAEETPTSSIMKKHFKVIVLFIACISFQFWKICRQQGELLRLVQFQDKQKLGHENDVSYPHLVCSLHTRTKLLKKFKTIVLFSRNNSYQLKKIVCALEHYNNAFNICHFSSRLFFEKMIAQVLCLLSVAGICLAYVNDDKIKELEQKCKHFVFISVEGATCLLTIFQNNKISVISYNYIIFKLLIKI